jgi:hypothetical protein
MMHDRGWKSIEHCICESLKAVAVEKCNFGDDFDGAGRSGAETLLGRQANVTRRRAFLISTFQETSSYEDHAFQEN